ncbi:MAG TPA: GDSL-type esterase/lipase family protein [Spirochaetota bacterium]|nr:GDSL-type esterase/lipase family protein [Spirochaetota bacterium]HPC40442.1 GDSL-type esterase/lipase family protein [Spirochaetota bacterium]HPL18093.1 GDSL-type esterase/lipase family protein [Spirochaetota bacterium]HQF06509.1 GDSL-type esterase/lipase family protein [Spirochaetota bacterium]HQH98094.1 GDSL-type esterase/lipase family protein [Spirochaetota bacterium]
MTKGKTILIFSISINVLLVAGIAGVIGWKYYRAKTRPFRTDYYEGKAGLFSTFPRKKADIVFVGDSHTDRCEWSELFDRCGIINRGIDGDTTDGVLNRLDEIIAMKPAKIFIMVGGADLIIGRNIPQIEKNYRKIIERIRAESPRTTVYIQSMLPTVQRLVPMPLDLIRGLNAKLKMLADGRNVFYIDLYRAMKDTSGGLNPSYSIDGVHLNGQGYRVWREALLPHIAK